MATKKVTTDNFAFDLNLARKVIATMKPLHGELANLLDGVESFGNTEATATKLTTFGNLTLELNLGMGAVVKVPFQVAKLGVLFGDLLRAAVIAGDFDTMALLVADGEKVRAYTELVAIGKLHAQQFKNRELLDKTAKYSNRYLEISGSEMPYEDAEEVAA